MEIQLIRPSRKKTPPILPKKNPLPAKTTRCPLGTENNPNPHPRKTSRRTAPTNPHPKSQRKNPGRNVLGRRRVLWEEGVERKWGGSPVKICRVAVRGGGPARDLGM